ncbi:MAG: ASCH domain-containing protein [Proteobacteria bacterium]|nr:ASCH domain-containing protein [Pseudomonadota bacterium]
MIQRAFFLQPRWASLVLSGAKNWELRSRRCRFRETVGIIETGSGVIVGVCKIVGCHGPLTEEELDATQSRHRTSREDRERPAGKRPYRFAWELQDVVSLPQPVPYNHVPGSQGWATISASTADRVAQCLR